MAIVVVNKYELRRSGGQYVKNGMVLQRENMKISENGFNRNNENYVDTGIWYEKDDKATKEWKIENQRQVEEREARNKLKDEENVKVMAKVIKESLAEEPKKKTGQKPKASKEELSDDSNE